MPGRLIGDTSWDEDTVRHAPAFSLDTSRPANDAAHLYSISSTRDRQPGIGRSSVVGYGKNELVASHCAYQQLVQAPCPSTHTRWLPYVCSEPISPTDPIERNRTTGTIPVVRNVGQSVPSVDSSIFALHSLFVYGIARRRQGSEGHAGCRSLHLGTSCGHRGRSSAQTPGRHVPSHGQVRRRCQVLRRGCREVSHRGRRSLGRPGTRGPRCSWHWRGMGRARWIRKSVVTACN